MPNKVRIAHGHGLSAASQSLCLGGQEDTGCKEAEVQDRPRRKGFFHADEQNARRSVELKILSENFSHCFFVIRVDSQSFETPEPVFLEPSVDMVRPSFGKSQIRLRICP